MIKKFYLGLVMITFMFSSSLFAQECLTLYADHQVVAPGEQICVDVKVKDFTDIVGFQHSIGFDPTQLSFVSITEGALANMSFGNVNEVSPTNHQINIVWLNTNLIETSLADESVIFTVCLEAVGPENSISQVSLGNGLIGNEFLNFDGQLKSVGFINPNITITSTGNPIHDLNVAGACASASYCEDAGGEISTTVQGGIPPYAYTWTGPNGFSSSAANLSGLGSGAYYLELTDQNGNTTFASFDITSYSLGAVDAVSVSPTCEEPESGNIQLYNANGGTDFDAYSVSWNTGATTSSIEGLSAGDYAVTLSAPSGNCEEILDFHLEDVPSLVVSGNCYQEGTELIGEIEIEAVCGMVPPLTFDWSDGTTTTSETTKGDFSIANPDSSLGYYATVTDANGVSMTSTNVFFTDCAGSFVVDAQIFNPDCTGGLGAIYLEVSPPGDYYDYLWNTGEETSAITDIEAGVYSVVVTNTQNNESSIHTYEVLASEGLFSASSYECVDGSDDVQLTVISWNGTPPFTFDWSTGESNTTEEIYNTVTVPNGIYDVTITDATGCSTVEHITAYCEPFVDINISPALATATPGESICFDIDVNNFTDVSAAQCSFHWNPTLLSFNEITDFGLPGLDVANYGIFADEGYVTFAWYNSSGSSSTLADGSTIFSLCFTAQNGGTGILEINSMPTPIEIVDSEGNTMGTHVHSAQYSVGTQSLSAEIGTTTQESQLGEEVCVDVYGKDLGTLLGAQFSLNWNPEELAFLNLDLTQSVLPNIAMNDFNIQSSMVDNGILLFAWLDESFSGAPIGEDDILFSVCYSTLISNGFAEVNVSSDPVPIEIVDIAEMAVLPQIENGGVNVSDGLVWPGDTDDNGVVNHFDLLNIGLAYGSTGAVRENGSDNWIGQTVPDWDNETPQSHTNYKYADCSGNGVVDFPDRNLILTNWEETNEFWNGNVNDFNATASGNATMSSSTPLYVDVQDVEEGQEATFDVILGEGSEVENVYGLAFTILYDPVAVVSGSLSLGFENSWLGTENEDFITVYKENQNNGRISVAITRIDGTPITGSGPIAQLNITIEDVIFRHDYLMFFDIQNIRMIDNQEAELLAVGRLTRGNITSRVAVSSPKWDAGIRLFPNPVTDRLNIQSKEVDISKIDIMTMHGRLVTTVNQPTEVSMKSLVPGIYYLRLHTNEGVTYRKVIKN